MDNASFCLIDTILRLLKYIIYSGKNDVNTNPYIFCIFINDFLKILRENSM